MTDPAPAETDGVAAPAGPASARRRPRRRHPALGARVVATGLSTAAMLGIVAALGIDAAAQAQAPPAPSLTAAAIEVPGPRGVPAGQDLTVVAVTGVTNEAIQLTAKPVVRAAAAPAAAQPQAAVATTNGSR
jgi:hypothetical protein